MIIPPPPLQTPIIDSSSESPLGTPWQDREKEIPSGNLTFPWSGWFNLLYQFVAQQVAKKYSQAITAVAGTPLVVTHNLGTTDIVVSAQDGSTPPNGMTIPGLEFTSVNSITVTFGISFTGRITVMG